MFLDKELKSISEAKARLAVSCELRRRLLELEIGDLKAGARPAMGGLASGLALAERAIDIWRLYRRARC